MKRKVVGTYDVQEIRSFKEENGEILFKVKWEGYKKMTNEPVENLKGCEVFEDFIRNDVKYQRYVNGKNRKIKRVLSKDLFSEREKISEKDKIYIIIEQTSQCNLCQQPLQNKNNISDFEIDHIIPLEQGGTNNFYNLQALCHICHKIKTTEIDSGIITRLLQAHFREKTVPTREEIVFHSRKYYKEMKESNKMITFDIEKKFSNKEENPPKPLNVDDTILEDKTLEKLKYIATIIDYIERMGSKGVSINLNGSKININIDDNEDKINKFSEEFISKLNEFFKKCLKNNKVEEKINNIIINFEK